jgi:hypothetical protein
MCSKTISPDADGGFAAMMTTDRQAQARERRPDQWPLIAMRPALLLERVR